MMWEYYTTKVVSPGKDSESFNARMRDLGLDGWELAAAEFCSDGMYRMFFKRPKQSLSDQPYR